jgi:hypothetical protein
VQKIWIRGEQPSGQRFSVVSVSLPPYGQWGVLDVALPTQALYKVNFGLPLTTTHLLQHSAGLILFLLLSLGERFKLYGLRLHCLGQGIPQRPL